MSNNKFVFHWRPDGYDYQLLWFHDAPEYRKALKSLGYWWNSSHLCWQKRVRGDSWAKEVENAASLGAISSSTGSDASASHADMMKLVEEAKRHRSQLYTSEFVEETITAPELVEGIGWDGVVYNRNIVFLGEEKVSITDAQKKILVEYAKKMKEANAPRFK